VNQAVVDLLLPRVEAYAAGRQRQKALRSQMRQLPPCEYETSFGATCHTSAPDGQWCAGCIAREPVWQEFAQVRRDNRELLRRIEVLAARLSLPEPPPPPAPTKDLLELMIAGGNSGTETTAGTTPEAHDEATGDGLRTI
jgi:hypothetical protein